MRHLVYLGFLKSKKIGLMPFLSWAAGNFYSAAYIRFGDLVYRFLPHKVDILTFSDLKTQDKIIKEYPIDLTRLTRDNIKKDCELSAEKSLNYLKTLKILFLAVAAGEMLVHQKKISEILYSHLGINVNPKNRTAKLKDLDQSLFFCSYKSIHYIGQ